MVAVYRKCPGAIQSTIIKVVKAIHRIQFHQTHAVGYEPPQIISNNPQIQGWVGGIEDVTCHAASRPEINARSTRARRRANQMNHSNKQQALAQDFKQTPRQTNHSTAFAKIAFYLWLRTPCLSPNLYLKRTEMKTQKNT